MHYLLILLPVLIALSWARLIRPGMNRLQGSVLYVVPLPLLARIRMHSMVSLLTIGIAMVIAVSETVRWWIVLVPLVSAILMIAIPVHYTLTDQGIRLGWGTFRRWTEFAGCRRAPGGARLQPVSGVRGMHIWLSRSRGDDEFLHVIRTLIRNAYKGKTTYVAYPGARNMPPVSAPPDIQTHGVSAFRRDPLS